MFCFPQHEVAALTRRAEAAEQQHAAASEEVAALRSQLSALQQEMAGLQVLCWARLYSCHFIIAVCDEVSSKQ